MVFVLAFVLQAQEPPQTEADLRIQLLSGQVQSLDAQAKLQVRVIESLQKQLKDAQAKCPADK